MDSADEAVAVEGRGLEGNADFDSRRHVTLVEKEVFEGLKSELSEDVEPSIRRANFLVSGIRLEDSEDRVLAVGDLRIRIRGETRPCMIMDQACPGRGTNWRGGAHGSVLNGAAVRIGDEVSWEDD